MNIIDLQIQSTASDGKHSPSEIIEMVKVCNLTVIAITDHDTVGGIQEALDAAKDSDMRIISGIEMSAEEHGIHILGYGINHRDERFLNELEGFKQGRIEGAKKMVENLKHVGFIVEWNDVVQEATGSVFARPHLARAVLKRTENREKLGIISNVHDFIEKFLSNESPLYIHRSHISAANAIKLIHNAGGVAVWSHPAIHFRDNYEQLEEFLRKMINWGINGVEVFNPSHTEDDTEFIQGLASKYHLLRTAGSDFHEKGEHNTDPVSGLHSARFLGDFETYGFSVDDVITRLDEAMIRFAQKDNT